MSAGRYSIVIERYATFVLVATWRDSAGVVINLTGYTAACQVRADPGSAVVVTPVVTLGGAAGTVTVTVTAATTTALAVTDDLVWDVVLTSAGGVKTRLLEGHATVKDGVTQ